MVRCHQSFIAGYGLDNIASCPEGTSIIKGAEDSEDSDKNDDREINIAQEINSSRKRCR